ncbi:hypothetical protein CRENPOLYSF2_160031 [Crenothrix polyspora]|uniref:Uncharacterized protein n=1 Tax=Crenothrix polyspora TaxID=360316 RepID=A0A1R4H280_9GAMM|nr:hypothetical protein CRENPOLYSF2_160031 [Crenothrix polyspora]
MQTGVVIIILFYGATLKNGLVNIFYHLMPSYSVKIADVLKFSVSAKFTKVKF